MVDILFPQYLEIQNPDSYWWVVHLKPNQWRNMSRDLSIENIPHFIPLVHQFRRTRSGRVKKKVPLIPGYAFFTGDNEQRRKVLQTDRAVKIIDVKNQDKLKFELDQLLNAVKSELNIKPNKKFKRGTPCRVVDGPAMGLMGNVLRTKGNCYVILEVETISQSFIVEVDFNMVEIL